MLLWSSKKINMNDQQTQELLREMINDLRDDLKEHRKETREDIKSLEVKTESWHAEVRSEFVDVKAEIVDVKSELTDLRLEMNTFKTQTATLDAAKSFRVLKGATIAGFALVFVTMLFGGVSWYQTVKSNHQDTMQKIESTAEKSVEDAKKH
jgi:hypothetical protein